MYYEIYKNCEYSESSGSPSFLRTGNTPFEKNIINTDRREATIGVRFRNIINSLSAGTGLFSMIMTS